MPDIKFRWRERDCALTETDVEEFHRRVRARFPDLCVFEHVDRSTVRLYDSFAKAEEEAMFCEERPDWLRDLEAREGPQTRMTGFRFDQAETPWLWLRLTPIRHSDLVRLYDDGEVFDLGREIRNLMTANIVQREGRLWGAYPETHTKAARFFTAVFNIAERFMTNSFEWFNLETGEYLYTEVGATYWTGPDSIKLGREDPDFYPLVEMPGDHEEWYAAKAVPRITGMGRGKKNLRRGAGGRES